MGVYSRLSSRYLFSRRTPISGKIVVKVICKDVKLEPLKLSKAGLGSPLYSHCLWERPVQHPWDVMGKFNSHYFSGGVLRWVFCTRFCLSDCQGKECAKKSWPQPLFPCTRATLSQGRHLASRLVWFLVSPPHASFPQPLILSLWSFVAVVVVLVRSYFL